MKRKFMLLSVLALFTGLPSFAQNFNKELKQQRSDIESVYRKKKITGKEYNKLIEEQKIIQNTLEKYNSDGYLSPEEKNRIASKLNRAARRLKRYQHNSERY